MVDHVTATSCIGSEFVPRMVICGGLESNWPYVWKCSIGFPWTQTHFFLLVFYSPKTNQIQLRNAKLKTELLNKHVEVLASPTNVYDNMSLPTCAIKIHKDPAVARDRQPNASASHHMTDLGAHHKQDQISFDAIKKTWNAMCSSGLDLQLTVLGCFSKWNMAVFMPRHVVAGQQKSEYAQDIHLGGVPDLSCWTPAI